MTLSSVPPPVRQRGESAATRRWESWTYWPLTGLALVWVIVYTAQVIGDVRGRWEGVAFTFMFAVQVVFAGDYVVRLLWARPRGVWFRAHLLDLAVVFVPILRPLRLLGALTRLTSFTRTAGSSVRAQLIIYGLGSVSLLIWQVALVVLQAERHTPGANILTFGDAIWWAVCTVTTVGYGDYAPVTVTGRLAAVVLMAGGVVLVGLIVATISSWASERVAQAHERKRAQASDADHPGG
ncbi:potassium channel family protein [Microbacterium sp. RURRCA19A]|uniref:potassium channel family protein n=1 Tax=Microbacterium sp. RURRCA19A TaxID=1907391 RepID=UPI00095739B0|nr:potassium channel family protein [Microbacterium sp. RURRCA19A]SIR98966.1 voltage-gated potassium channel [Microbacterium sp. RURRCA19A]